MQQNFNQITSPQLNQHVSDESTVLIKTKDGKLYSNRSWDSITQAFKDVVREPA